MVEKPKGKPGRWRYGLAIALMLVGTFAFLLAFEVLKTTTEDMVQVIVPGESTITVEEPGDFTIFYESQSTVDGRVFSTGDLPGINIEIRSNATGEPVSIKKPSATTSYSLGGRSGQSIAAFSVQETGDYTLAAAYPEGAEGTERVLAVGSGSGGVGRALVAGGIGMAAFLAGLVIGLRTFFRRRKAKRNGDGPTAGQAAEPFHTPA